LNANFNKLTLELNLELNTLGYIYWRFWDVDVDLLPRTLHTFIALKSNLFSKLHIIPKNSDIYYLKLIKWYLCTICFISSDATNRTKQLCCPRDRQAWVANGT